MTLSRQDDPEAVSKRTQTLVDEYFNFFGIMYCGAEVYHNAASSNVYLVFENIAAEPIPLRQACINQQTWLQAVANQVVDAIWIDLLRVPLQNPLPGLLDS